MNALVLREIQAEVERAMRKFQQWPTDPIHAAAVIAEECGELQKATLEAVYEPHKGSRPNIRTEAVQTAAMCLRFIASLDEYEWFNSKQHPQNASLDRPAAYAGTVETKPCQEHSPEATAKASREPTESANLMTGLYVLVQYEIPPMRAIKMDLFEESDACDHEFVRDVKRRHPLAKIRSVCRNYQQPDYMKGTKP